MPLCSLYLIPWGTMGTNVMHNYHIMILPCLKAPAASTHMQTKTQSLHHDPRGPTWAGRHVQSPLHMGHTGPSLLPALLSSALQLRAPWAPPHSPSLYLLTVQTSRLQAGPPKPSSPHWLWSPPGPWPFLTRPLCSSVFSALPRECKLHEGKGFGLFCFMPISGMPRTLPGT